MSLPASITRPIVLSRHCSFVSKGITSIFLNRVEAARSLGESSTCKIFCSVLLFCLLQESSNIQRSDMKKYLFMAVLDFIHWANVSNIFYFCIQTQGYYGREENRSLEGSYK